MSGKTYHVGVTNVEDLTPHLPLLVSLPKFCSYRGLNSCPPVEELGALTNELTSPFEIVWMSAWQCTLFFHFSRLADLVSYLLLLPIGFGDLQM